MLEKKLYLVVCTTERAAIEALKMMHLKMQVDFMDKNLKVDRQRVRIVSNKIEVHFVSTMGLRRQEAYPYRYAGVVRTCGFYGATGEKTREFYQAKLNETRKRFGINDKDGLLKMYVKGAM